MAKVKQLIVTGALLALGWHSAGTRALAADTQQPAKTIEIHAKQFRFVPDAITLKRGETVKLVLLSDDVPHSLAVEGLPIHAAMVKDKPTDLLVTPETDGDYQGKCAKFCGSGHRDMHFVVHVVD